MSKLIVFLLLLIAALQYRLWFGDGGVEELRETTHRIEELQHAAVAADVIDLRDGSDAIEERARHDLGMVKPGETYVQVYDEETQTPIKPLAPEVTVDQPKARNKGHAKAKPPGKAITPSKH